MLILKGYPIQMFLKHHHYNSQACIAQCLIQIRLLVKNLRIWIYGSPTCLPQSTQIFLIQHFIPSTHASLAAFCRPSRLVDTACLAFIVSSMAPSVPSISPRLLVIPHELFPFNKIDRTSRMPSQQEINICSASLIPKYFKFNIKNQKHQ